MGIRLLEGENEMRSIFTKIVIAAIILSVPGTLFTVGWGLSLIFKESASITVFLLCCATISISALSLASLSDNQ